MRFLALVLVSLLLAGCGGGGEPPVANINATFPSPTRNAAQVTGSAGIAIHVYQALYGQAPSNAMLTSYVSQIGTGNGFDWADSMAASFSSTTDSALSTLVLNNISITPTNTSQQTFDVMHDALMWYFQAVGVARRGTVIVQLSDILSPLESDAVFGKAAISFNVQTAANYAYSSNVANTVATSISVSVGVPVAQVTVTTPTVSMETGTIIQLSAAALDNSGTPLADRLIVWSSGNNAIATVSSMGKLTGVAAGTVTISATSEGKTGTVSIAVITAGTILTGVRDAYAFITQCATSDPAYAMIQKDFQILNDSQPFAGSIVCTDPYTTNPISQMSEELLTMQTLRLIYYMSIGTEGKLPWTSLSLYDWMKSQIAGVNIVAAQGYSSCCALLNGKKYMTVSRKSADSLNLYRTWPTMAAWLALMAHETRHAAGYSHVNGCPAFPLPSDPQGCDPTYDESNLGAYGIQRWLYANWATGALNVGIACSTPADALSIAMDMARGSNSYGARFVSSPPADITAPTLYGGICYPQ